MATRYGGPLPDTKYGFEITVEPPAAVDADPLDQWEVVRISGVAADGSGYKAAAAVAGDTSDAVHTNSPALNVIDVLRTPPNSIARISESDG